MPGPTADQLPNIASEEVSGIDFFSIHEHDRRWVIDLLSRVESILAHPSVFTKDTEPSQTEFVLLREVTSNSH